MRGKSAYPGFHLDDWEGYQLRVERSGSVFARATSHGHYQGCKQRRCRNRWTAWTGWTRVSKGSHAGHIPLPAPDEHERTSTAPALRLVPLETIDRSTYEPLPGGIDPPWTKEAYRDPLSKKS